MSICLWILYIVALQICICIGKINVVVVCCRWYWPVCPASPAVCPPSSGYLWVQHLYWRPCHHRLVCSCSAAAERWLVADSARLPVSWHWPVESWTFVASFPTRRSSEPAPTPAPTWSCRWPSSSVLTVTSASIRPLPSHAWRHRAGSADHRSAEITNSSCSSRNTTTTAN